MQVSVGKHVLVSDDSALQLCTVRNPEEGDCT